MAVTVRVPYGIKDKGEVGTHGSGHEQMLNGALPGAFELTVEFKSDKEGKDVKAGEDVHFAWEGMRGTLDLERMFGKRKYTLRYRWHVKLKSDGSAEGTGSSTMEANGDRLEQGNALKKRMDDWVQDEVLKAGVLPIRGKYKVYYVNEKLDKTYNSVEGFIGAYAQYGVGFPDPAHREYMEKFKRVQIRKELGVDWGRDIEQAENLVGELTRELRDARKEKASRQRIERLEVQLKRVEELLGNLRKSRTEGDEAERDKIMKEMDELYKGEVKVALPYALVVEGAAEETLERVMKKREPFPSPKSEDAKEFVRVVGKYVKDIDGWMTPQTMRSMMKEFGRGATEGEIGKVRGLLAPFIKDLKARRDGLGEAELEAFKKRTNFGWVDDPKKLMSELEGELEGAVGGKALRFPHPESGPAKELIGIFEKYGMDKPLGEEKGGGHWGKPNPMFWLDPGDFAVLGKSLGVSAHRWLNEQLKKAPKGMKKDEREGWIKGKRDEVEKDLERARGLFGPFIEDMHARMERYKKEHGEQARRISEEHDIGWTSDKSKVERAVGRAVEGLGVKEIEKEKKDTAPYSLEYGKYELLLADMKRLKADFGPVSDKLSKVSLVPEVSEDKRRAIREKMEASRKHLDELMAKAELSGEARKRVEDLRGEAVEIERVIKELKSGSTVGESIARLKAQLERYKKNLGSIEDPSFVHYKKMMEEGISETERDIEALGKFEGKVDLGEDIKKLEEIQRSISKEIEKIQTRADVNEEEAADIKKLGVEIDAAARHVQGLRAQLGKASRIPALDISKYMLGQLEYFSDLYSVFSRAIWFRNMPEPAYKEAGIDDAKESRSKVLGLAKSLVGYGITAKDEIVKTVGKLRTALKEFIDDVSEGYYEYRGTYKVERRAVWDAMRDMVVSLDEKERGRMESLLPADKLQHMRKLIEDIKDEGERSKLTKDLDQLTESLYKGLRETSGSTFQEMLNDKVKKLVEKGKSQEKARSEAIEEMKRVQKAMVDEGFNVLTNRVMDVKETEAEAGKKKPSERSPMGNKPAAEYKNMVKMVKQMVPDLSVGGKKEEAPKKPGIPTGKEMTDFMLDAWMRVEMERGGAPHTMAEVEDFYAPFSGRFEGEKYPGSDVQKGRKRKKAPPIVPASHTKENLKNVVRKLVTTKSAKEAVMSFLADYIVNIKKNISSGEDVTQEDAVDALVSGLKTFYYTITGMRATPSHTLSMHKIKAEPPAFPGKGKEGPIPPREYKGRPDFTLDSYDEAVKLYDKLLAIYGVIEHYIEPDKLGLALPSKIPSQAKEHMPGMPNGFWEAIDVLQKNEKKAYEGMISNVISRYAWMDDLTADEIDEFEAVRR